MRVYISGPMTGYVDFNRPAFHAAAARLRALGYDVVNPAELDENEPMPATAGHADYLRRDIRVLVDCDLIYLLPGWKHSKGARGEAMVSELCGICFLVDSDIDLWRTFEGEPVAESPDLDDVTPPTRIRRHNDLDCDPVEGDGMGNAWCSHKCQVRFAQGIA